MSQTILGKVDLEAELSPETDLERTLLGDPAFFRGLFWGVPRYGHPEGEVYKHVREVLANIDRLEIDAVVRRKLRLIAYVHDTFKYREDKTSPRDWSLHHGVFARQFLESFTSDPGLLNIVELHDEAYYSWRIKFLFHQLPEGEARLQRLLETLGDDLQLFYLFFKCDTLTGDKNPAPLKWFEKTIPGITVVEL